MSTKILHEEGLSTRDEALSADLTARPSAPTDLDILDEEDILWYRFNLCCFCSPSLRRLIIFMYKSFLLLTPLGIISWPPCLNAQMQMAQTLRGKNDERWHKGRAIPGDRVLYFY